MTDSKQDPFGILLSNCQQIDTLIGKMLQTTLTTSISQQLQQISRLNDKNRSFFITDKKQESNFGQILLNLEQSLKQQITNSFSHAAAEFYHGTDSTSTKISTACAKLTTIGDHDTGTDFVTRADVRTPNFTEIKDTEFDTMLDEIVDNTNEQKHNYNIDTGNNSKIDDILQSALQRAITMSNDDISVSINANNLDTNPNNFEKVSEKMVVNINGRISKEEKLDEFDTDSIATTREEKD